MSEAEIQSLMAKIDALHDKFDDFNIKNVKAHAILEGQELDRRLTSIEKKFWPLVGVFSVLGPVLTAVVVSYVKLS
jgi:hypothetical protein